jgi:hypothetical protein
LRLEVIRIDLTASEVDSNTSGIDLDVAESIVVVGSELEEINVGQVDSDFPSLIIVNKYLEVRFRTNLGSDIYRCIKFSRNTNEISASTGRTELHADCIVFLLGYKDLLAQVDLYYSSFILVEK